MLSNAYFLAKFRFDTAENEPAKNLQNLQNFAKLANFADPSPLILTLTLADRFHEDPLAGRVRGEGQVVGGPALDLGVADGDHLGIGKIDKLCFFF